MTPLWMAYEMPPEWYQEHWPDVVTMIPRWDLVQEIGTGLWFRYPDTGARVHLLDLIPCADGWTPQTLRDGRYVGNHATDPADSLEFEETGVEWPRSPEYASAKIAWRALSEQAARRAQPRKASKAPRRSKWQSFRDRVDSDAVALWSANPTLAESDLATAKTIARQWAEEGLDIPPFDTIRSWISTIQWPPIQNFEC